MEQQKKEFKLGAFVGSSLTTILKTLLLDPIVLSAFTAPIIVVWTLRHLNIQAQAAALNNLPENARLQEVFANAGTGGFVDYVIQIFSVSVATAVVFVTFAVFSIRLFKTCWTSEKYKSEKLTEFYDDHWPHILLVSLTIVYLICAALVLIGGGAADISVVMRYVSRDIELGQFEWPVFNSSIFFLRVAAVVLGIAYLGRNYLDKKNQPTRPV